MMMMGTALLYQAMTVSAQTATTSAQTLTAVSQVSTQPVADKATGVEVDHLGVSNTLVRVTGEGKYLLLPVQEANDDARINVLVDGNVVETIRVRLAKSKIDYSVPYDLSPYKGKNVILDIVTSQGRSSVREAKDDACWKGIRLVDAFDTANREKYRPAYHHTPLYGWMNDPNGMFYKDGKWHLYYQYNPYGSKWQNLSWGHSESADLVNWEHKPVAVKPDGLGMIFSGSCVVDKANTAGFGENAVVAMYTSADVSQMQSVASSTDGGITFATYPYNPVITLESEARDPNMFWNEVTGEWNLALAHALDHEMLFFTSSDLKRWTLQSSFGKGLGCQDGVWECPDLFKLKVDGSGEEKWMLICSINPGGPFGGSATQYFIGDFDGKTFTPDRDADGSVPTKWMDYGKDHYATVSWSNAPDGRRTVIGWMSNWQYAAEVPTQQFRSANTLPREVGLFKAGDGRIYASTVPSPEVDALRGKVVKHVSKMSAGRKAKRFALPELCEITLDAASRRGGNVILTLGNDKGEKVVMTYYAANGTLSFDRRESGITDFSQDFPAVTTASTFTADGKLGLRIFVDRSSIEVFGKDGRFAMTNLVFPRTPYTSLTVSSDRAAQITSLNIYEIKETK